MTVNGLTYDGYKNEYVTSLYTYNPASILYGSDITLKGANIVNYVDSQHSP